MHNDGDKRELYNGFGDTLARAFEFVGAPAVFGLLGHAVDVRLHTNPAFTVILVVFALAGTFVRMYYEYETAMKRQEAARATLHRPGGVARP